MKYRDKSGERFWKKILAGDKILADKEARELKIFVKKMRKNGLARI